MPSFHLTQEDARTLVRWFKVKSGAPSEGELFQADVHDDGLVSQGENLFGKTGLGCNGCHPRGDVVPNSPGFIPADSNLPWPEFAFDVPDTSFYVVWKGDSGYEHQDGFVDADAAEEWAQAKFGASGGAYTIGKPWDKSSWGPDLGLAAARLRPSWMFDWLKDPPKFMPGTKMPNFFGSSDDPMSGGHPLDGSDADPEAIQRMKALVRFLVHMKTAGPVAKN